MALQADITRALKRMRESKRHSVTLTVVAVVAITLGLWSILLSKGPQTSRIELSNRVWFYDMQTSKRFAAPRDEIPPIAAPSGGDTGVLAHVYTCGDCNSSDANQRVAYLEVFSPQARQQLVDAQEQYRSQHGIDASVDMLLEMMPQLHQQRMFKRPEDRQWRSWAKDARQINTILRGWADSCRKQGKALRTCYPTDEWLSRGAPRARGRAGTPRRRRAERNGTEITLFRNPWALTEIHSCVNFLVEQ